MGNKCDTNVILRSLYDSVIILTYQIEADQVNTFNIYLRDLNSMRYPLTNIKYKVFMDVELRMDVGRFNLRTYTYSK